MASDSTDQQRQDVAIDIRRVDRYLQALKSKYLEKLEEEKLLPLAVQMATAEKNSVDLDYVRAAISMLAKELTEKKD